MKAINFRSVSPVVTCRAISQAEKDQSAERRRLGRIRRKALKGAK
jgi:hypothetical protein